MGKSVKDRFSLRFSPDLEELFEKENARDRSHALYVRGYLAIFVYLLFLIPDHYMIADIIKEAFIIRLGIMTPLLIIGMIIQRSNPPALIRESLESLLIFLTAVSLIILITMSKSELSIIYHPGVSLVLIFANLIVRLRLPHALAVSALTLIIYIAFIPLYAGNSLAIQVFNVVFLISSISFSMVANYSLEKEKRKKFLLVYNERRKSDFLSEENSELQNLSLKDSLTGLANRRGMEIFIREAIVREGGHRKFGVILIDVDYFKNYNDAYGHQAGDDCLKAVGKALESVVRMGHDLAARYGGEEFILILPSSDAEKIREIARRISKEIAGLDIPHRDSPITSRLTVSAGITMGTPSAQQEMEELIREADKALYQAKREGRNRSCFYNG